MGFNNGVRKIKEKTMASTERHKQQARAYAHRQRKKKQLPYAMEVIEYVRSNDFMDTQELALSLLDRYKITVSSFSTAPPEPALPRTQSEIIRAIKNDMEGGVLT